MIARETITKTAFTVLFVVSVACMIVFYRPSSAVESILALVSSLTVCVYITRLYALLMKPLMAKPRLYTYADKALSLAVFVGLASTAAPLWLSSGPNGPTSLTMLLFLTGVAFMQRFGSDSFQSPQERDKPA